jgi:hypothetical protein
LFQLVAAGVESGRVGEDQLSQFRELVRLVKLYAEGSLNAIPPTDGLGAAFSVVIPAAEGLGHKLRAAAHHADLLAINTAKTDKALQDLLGNIDEEQALADLEEQFRASGDAALAAYAAASKGSADAAEKARVYEQAQRDLKREVVAYAEQVKEIPRERFTAIVALIDEGKIAEAEARMKILTRNRTMWVSIQTKGGIGLSEDGARAAGGPVRAGGAYLVGERGPELMVPKSSGNIVPNHQLGAAIGGGSPINLTVNVGAGADGALIGRKIVEEIRRYERMSGTGWRS